MNAAPPRDAFNTNLESEQALLGAILVNNDVWVAVSTYLKPEHFSEPIHQQIFKVCADMIGANKQANPITIRSFLPDQMIGDMPMRGYLAQLCSAAPFTTADLSANFGRVVFEDWLWRQARSVAEDISQMVTDRAPDQSIIDVLDAGMSELARLHGLAKESTAVTTYAEVLARGIEKARKVHSGEEPAFDWFLPEITAIAGQIRSGTLIGIMSDSGGGKGQPLDAPVLTPWGFRPMGDIKVGSVVTAADGTASQVIGVYPLGERDIYAVAFSDGTEAEVTDDHLWLAWPVGRNRTRNGKLQYAKDMSKLYTTAQLAQGVGGGRRYRIPSVEPVSFIAGASAKQRKIPPYTLGALLGDGCFRNTSLSITTDDIAVVQRIESELGRKLNRPGERKHYRTPTYIIPFASGIKSEIEREGLWGAKSGDKFIPAQYLLASIEDRWALLQGLLDTDGYVAKASTAEYATKSKRLAADVAWLARSLGAIVKAGTKRTGYRDSNGRRVDCGTGHRLWIKFPHLVDAFGLARKRRQCGKPQSMGKSVVSVVKVRRAPAQCIKIDHPSSLYVTNDFIVTHNTSFALRQSRYQAQKGIRTAFLSIEITDADAAMQTASQALAIPMDRLDSLDVVNSEMDRIGEELKTDIPLRIVEYARCTLADIHAQVVAMRRQWGLQVAVIDHAKLIELPGKANENFADRINALYRGLKAIAKETGVAVIILIQRNDSWKQRGSPRPIPGDAYGGGSVQQCLDVWFSIYRPDLFADFFRDKLAATKKQEDRDRLSTFIEEHKEKAILINHKRRRGAPQRSRPILFIGETTTFRSIPVDQPGLGFEE